MIYTYLCNKCNRKFDILYGKEAIKCNICRGEDVKRVFTAPMVKVSKESGSSCSSCARTSCASCK